MLLVIASCLVVVAGCAAPVVAPAPPVQSQVSSEPTATPLEKLTIGMIYISPVQIPWSFAHREGLRQALEVVYSPSQGMQVEEEGEGFRVLDSTGNAVVNTLSWTATTDFSATEASRVARDMISKGAGLIFVTAENWCQDLHENVAPAYPDVGFACIRGPVAPNLISMYPKSWEGFCVACAAAAAIVDEPNLGMLGAYAANPQVASNHGACAACFADAWADKDDSQISVSTVYINNWENLGDETAGALALRDEGVKVVAVHQDSTAAGTALVETDVWVIGYDSSWRERVEPNDHILTSVVIDWSEIYELALMTTREGTFQGLKWNPGLAEGAVKLDVFSPTAPSVAGVTAETYREKLRAGWRPCGGDDVMWAMDSWQECHSE
ncbi:BMP family ABC transporter substrate-binding protein [Patescibacteria group bacterium]|nr:BMP family ABC transporter substrate-binding protein [Patescibacteria group bacterium]MBU1970194.1 BMP family ABC transporter substrate-binding protein [Patescibacteria group bacterium]MBU2025990.1 BMP family ABC transporter substrate-binding protein [Patescibacteria group bacterium]